MSFKIFYLLYIAMLALFSSTIQLTDFFSSAQKLTTNCSTCASCCLNGDESPIMYYIIDVDSLPNFSKVLVLQLISSVHAKNVSFSGSMSLPMRSLIWSTQQCALIFEDFKNDVSTQMSRNDWQKDIIQCIKKADECKYVKNSEK